MNWPALWLVSTFFLMLVVIVEAHRWYHDDPTRSYLWLSGVVIWAAARLHHTSRWLTRWAEKLVEAAERL